MLDDKNFRVAFGLSGYDDSPDFIEDPDYVTVEASMRSWGIESGVVTLGDNLKTRRCTREDFGLDYYNTTDLYERESMPKPLFFEPK